MNGVRRMKRMKSRRRTERMRVEGNMVGKRVIMIERKKVSLETWKQKKKTYKRHTKEE